MRKAMVRANFYPDDDCTQLRWKLAGHHGLPPEQVLVGAGSTELISLLCQTLLGPGRNAVTSERSFIIYSMAVRAAGSQLIEAAMRDGCFDLDAILAAIDSNTRIIFLANPNNPTGTMLEAAAVKRFLARIPDHVVVVLDEAYYEFALYFAALGKITYSNSVEYVRAGARVVVLRTFSKAHGLAGLRVGYGLGPAELLGYCARMRNTFSVSSVGQVAGLAAFGRDDPPVSFKQCSQENSGQAEFHRWVGRRYLVPSGPPTSCICDFGEGKRGGSLGDPLIAVKEAVVIAERFHQRGRFFFDGIVIADLWTKNGGLDSAFIADAMETAEHLD